MDDLKTQIFRVLQDVPNMPVREPLMKAFADRGAEFAAIEDGFRSLTSRRQVPETLRRFFTSWSQTNTSAMTVAGIGNRLTLKLHHGEPVRDQIALLHCLTALHRISDEDQAVTHKVLHSKMYYDMATGIDSTRCDLEAIVAQYLQRKAAVPKALFGGRHD